MIVPDGRGSPHGRPADFGHSHVRRRRHRGRFRALAAATLLVLAVLVVAGTARDGKADPTPSPAYNLVLPTISGTAQVGSTLTASPGTWSQTATFGYQWYRCSPTNLVSNSGFESDTSGWTTISNGNKPTTISRVSSPVHSGAWSLAINFSNSTFDGVKYASIPIDPSQAYHFSAWIYVPAVSKWQDSRAQETKLYSQAFDASGNPLTFPPSSSDFIGNGNNFVGPGWTQVSSGVGTSIFSQAASEQFRMINYGFSNTTIYLDDVWFNACNAIQGATNQTYIPTELDANSKLMVDVLATDAWGTTDWDSDETPVTIDTEAGTADSDQSADSGDDTPTSPAAPLPMSPSGPAAPGTYSTDLWPGDATETTDGLYVVSSTASGTSALSGVVDDSSTGGAVANASVTLACTSGCTGSATTATDAQGSFAFINMPAGTYNLTASAGGYGTYSITNDPYTANVPYETTISLDSTNQTYDMANGAGTIADNSNLDASLPGTFYSQRRVPPAVRVEMLNTYPRSAGSLFCQTSGGPASPPVVNYRFPFYVIHVVWPEVGGLGYNQTAMKAFMAIVQNFAWFHKTKGGPYDVADASNVSQCFEPREKVNIPVWNTWLQDALSKRIADGNGNLRETPYASGTTTACSDPAEPAHGGKASQLGLRTHSINSSCLISDWRDLATYYYPTDWHLFDSSANPPYAPLAPPTPSGTASVSGGTITFNFSSTVFGQNVAWRFYIQRWSSTTGWRTFLKPGWNPATRTVRNSFSYTPGSGCVRYAVRAVNPVGESPRHTYTPPGVGLSPSGQCNL
jgi:Carboxypeptidase regulatory-like domain